MIQGKHDETNGERVTTDPGFPPGTGERASRREREAQLDEGDEEADIVTAQAAPTNPGGRGYPRNTLPRLPIQRDTLPDPPERRGGFMPRPADPGPPVEAPADVDSLLDAFGHPKSPNRAVPQVRETAGQASAAYHGPPHALHARRVTLPPQPPVVLNTTDEYPIIDESEEDVPISEDIEVQDAILTVASEEPFGGVDVGPGLTVPEPLYTAPLGFAQAPRGGELPMVETRKIEFPVGEQEPTFIPHVRVASRTKWLIGFAAFGLVSVLLIAFFEARSTRAVSRSTTLTSGAWQAASGSSNAPSGTAVDAPVRPIRRRAGDLNSGAVASQKSADSPLDDLAPSIPGDPNATPGPVRLAPAENAKSNAGGSNALSAPSPSPQGKSPSPAQPPPAGETTKSNVTPEPVRAAAPVAPRPAPEPPAADYELFKQHRK